MKTKKLLSIISAAAMTVTALSGSMLTVNAADTYIANLTFAGQSQSDGVYPITADEGSKYHNYAKRANSYTWTAEGQEELKALYDADNDDIIDDVFVNSYFDYIGKEVNVSISVDLQPGKYTIYYGGVSGQITEARLENETTLQQKSSIVLHAVDETAPEGVSNEKTEFMVIPFNITLTESYSGTITFTNPGGWLPDLCSIKLVGVGFNTQNDVIQAEDIIRGRDNKDQFTEYTINEENYEKIPEEAKTKFGNNLENAGNIALTYTDGTDDYTYLEITEAGTYAVDIIGAASERDQKITFTNSADNIEAETLVVSNISNIATASKSDGKNDSVHYFTSNKNVVLTEGIYKVGIIKNTSNYYTNFIAMALRQVAEPAPEEEPDFVAECTNLGVAEGKGDYANTHATMFGIKVTNNGGKGTFNTVNSSVTSNKDTTENTDGNTKQFSETITKISLERGASIVIGAIIDGLNDAAATMTTTVE